MLEQLSLPMSEEKWHQVLTTYRAMHRGPGSFGDFHVWRETVEERIDANRELQDILNAIWHYLGG